MKIPTICIAGHRFITDKQGGVELQTWYIGKALARAGWRVVYLAPSFKGATGKEVIEEYITVQWYPHFSFSFQVPKKLLNQILDDLQPAVLYQRGRGQLAGNGFILDYARRRGIPYVFGLSSDSDLESDYEIKTLMASHKSLWKKIILIPYAISLDRSMRRILSRANVVVCQHEGQTAGLGRRFDRHTYVLRSVHPEVGREVAKPSEKIVLWINNYRPLKQGELFVKLSKSLDHLNCRFVMVYGRTKSEYIEPVLRMGKEVDNLTFKGEVSPQMAEELMEKAALFVNTSVFEGFPNTFVQSWLRETPTVSLNVDPGGVIARENIGLVSESFEKLVEDVSCLINHDDERREMGGRARAYAEREHGYEHNLHKIVEFFDGVIEDHSKPN